MCSIRILCVNAYGGEQSEEIGFSETPTKNNFRRRMEYFAAGKKQPSKISPPNLFLKNQEEFSNFARIINL